MARLRCLALTMAIAPAAHAQMQTLFQRAAATITSMGPVITDSAAFEGYTSLAGLSSCEPPPENITSAMLDRMLTTARLGDVLRPRLDVQIVRRDEQPRRLLPHGGQLQPPLPV